MMFTISWAVIIPRIRNMKKVWPGQPFRLPLRSKGEISNGTSILASHYCWKTTEKSHAFDIVSKDCALSIYLSI